MNWNHTWIGIVVLGILLVVADLIMRFGLDFDSVLGTHVYSTIIIEGNVTNQHFVIPATLGSIVTVVGVIGILVTKKNRRRLNQSNGV